MPRVSDLLDRLRPAGAPGPAGVVGIPADRRAAAQRELAPVFAALAATVQEAAGLRAVAIVEAADIERQAAGRVAAVIAQARADEAAERARASTRVRANARPELIQLAEQAAAAADAVRHSTAERLPIAVDLILARARARMDQLTSALAGPADPVGRPR